MNCIFENELPDFELMAALEGEASQEVVAHLEQCPYCRHRLESLRGEQAVLKARLFRSQCPTALELGEYQLDKLPTGQRMAIAGHLRDCPHCRAEVRQLESYLRELALAEQAPGPQPTEPFRVLVARLLGGARAAPAWAGVRGAQNGAESGARIYQVEDVQVTIDVQEDPREPERRVLLGLVIGAPPAELEAHLWRQDERVLRVAVEEAGNFILPGVEPGKYALSLRGRSIVIEIQELDVS